MFVALFVVVVVVVVVARASVRPCVVVCRHHSSQMDRHIHSFIHSCVRARHRVRPSVAPRSTDRPPASCVTFFNGSRLVRRARPRDRNRNRTRNRIDLLMRCDRSILFQATRNVAFSRPFFVFSPLDAQTEFFLLSITHTRRCRHREVCLKKK